jgi:hypothetical protein
MSYSNGPKIVTNGLVLALDAANKKSYPGSGTTWTDLSGNGNNGTLVNGPTFDGGNVGSIVFDGVDDYVNLGNVQSINNVDAKTFSFWHYLQTTTVGSTNLIFGYQSQTNPTGTRSYFDDNNISGQLRVVENGVSFGTIPGFFVYDQWNNVTIVSGNLNITAYRNGVFIGARNGMLNPSVISNINFQIGYGYHSGGDRRSSGKFSTLQIYNRALSPQEVQRNYEALRGRYGI